MRLLCYVLGRNTCSGHWVAVCLHCLCPPKPTVRLRLPSPSRWTGEHQNTLFLSSPNAVLSFGPLLVCPRSKKPPLTSAIPLLTHCVSRGWVFGLSRGLCETNVVCLSVDQTNVFVPPTAVACFQANMLQQSRQTLMVREPPFLCAYTSHHSLFLVRHFPSASRSQCTKYANFHTNKQC